MSDQPISGRPLPDEVLGEAHRRLARLHYAFSTADALNEALHQRAIDDLMDVLELLEPLMATRSGGAGSRSAGV